MSGPLTRDPRDRSHHAVRVWLDSATQLFTDARRELELEEWDAFLDVFLTLIARHFAREHYREYEVDER